jgi:hypothetical protein
MKSARITGRFLLQFFREANDAVGFQKAEF